MRFPVYSFRIGGMAAVAVALAATGARANINGFGDFSNFTINQSDGVSAPVISIPAGSIKLTVAANNVTESRSIFCNTPQNISQFTASFTYQRGGTGFDIGGCFVI